MQITPETDDNTVGTFHTVTATVSAGGTGTGAAPAGGCNAATDAEIDFELVSSDSGVSYTFASVGGAITGSPDAAETNNSPDATCTTGTGGNAASTCVISYTRSTAGSDEIIAWIDIDKNNGSVEADRGTNKEGQAEATSPGDGTEPDDTDVAAKTWSGSAPTNRALDCDDASGDDAATNPHIGTGSTEAYTCRVVNTNGTDATGDDTPVSGVKIDAENETSTVNDPGDDGSAAGTADYNDFCTTDANGTCTGNVTSEGQQGTATLCFWADFDADTRYDRDGDEQDGGNCDVEGGDDNIVFGGGEARTTNATTDKAAKTWEQARADSLAVTPQADNNLVNTSHTVTATVLNQFGDPQQGVNVDVRVTGRNTRTQNDLVTDANGQVTFTYTDTGAAGTGGTDTITVCTDLTDDDDCPNANDPNEDVTTASKNWVTSLPTVAAVTLDMQMDDDLPAALGGNDADDCPEGTADANATATNTVGVWAGTSTPAANGPGGAGDTVVHEICATATDANNAAVIGQEFTFTITGPGNFTNEAGANLGKTVTVGSDQAGHAHAAVTSTEAGTTTVQVSTGGQTDSGTKTWRGTAARTLDCEPETQAVESPGSAVVTCTAKDVFGNPTTLGNTADAVADTVTCSETGPGRITSSLTPTLSAAGTVEVVSETTSGELGVQTVSCELTVDVPDVDSATDTDDECDQAAGRGLGGTAAQTGAPAGACEDSVDIDWGGREDPTVREHERSVNLAKPRHANLGGRRRLLLRATVSSGDFSSCAAQVPINFQVRAGGTWVTIKSDTTNQNGVAKGLVQDLVGKYRAKASKFQIEDTDNNTIDVCLRAISNKRRHRHG